MSRERILSLGPKDFEMQTFCVGGHGGQNMQKNQTGVRLIHTASGARGESRDERSQLQNKKKAFERLVATEKFQNWLKVEHARRSNAIPTREQVELEVAQMIENDLAQGKIIVEHKEGDKWVKDKI